MSIIVSVSNDPLLLTPTLNQGQENISMCVKCNRTQKKKKGNRRRLSLKTIAEGMQNPFGKPVCRQLTFAQLAARL